MTGVQGAVVFASSGVRTSAVLAAAEFGAQLHCLVMWLLCSVQAQICTSSWGRLGKGRGAVVFESSVQRVAAVSAAAGFGAQLPGDWAAVQRPGPVLRLGSGIVCG